MPRMTLPETDHELRIDDRVQDGRANARVVDRDGAGVKIKYDADGETIWIQDNRFMWDDNDGWVVV